MSYFFRLVLQPLPGLLLLPLPVLDHFEQLLILVRDDVLGDLRELLLLLFLLLELALLLSHDVVLVLLVRNSFHLFLFVLLLKASKFFLSLWHIPFSIVFVIFLMFDILLFLFSICRNDKFRFFYLDYFR